MSAVSPPGASAPVAAAPSPAQPLDARPLDAFAVSAVLGLCLCWGLSQVTIKLALPDFPPFSQGAIRSFGATLIIVAWMWLRGLPLFAQDGTLRPGLIVGVIFGIEFILIYQALEFTTASRATLFLYLMPFFVAIAARWLVPADRFSASQWAGLSLSFLGMVVAFGVPTPGGDPRELLGDLMMVGGALGWAACTLMVKATALRRVSFEKAMLYQLVISGPMLAVAALLLGERISAAPSAAALGALAYQTLWIVPVTFVAWCGLIQRYSASRLSSFTVLTPIFGVLAGHLLLGDPLTPAFLVAVALVVAGLILVNRPR